MQARGFRKISGLFTLYLFFCSLVVSLLFVTGNLQAFLESTNRLLLRVQEWIITIFLITDLYFLGFTVLDYLRKKERQERPILRIGRLAWGMGGFLYGAVILVLINIIFAWL